MRDMVVFIKISVLFISLNTVGMIVVSMVESDKSEEKLLFKYVSAEQALTCLSEIGNSALLTTQPAVGVLYYTERTPKQIVLETEGRLRIPNNRHGVQKVTKLVLAESACRYKEEQTTQIGNCD